MEYQFWFSSPWCVNLIRPQKSGEQFGINSNCLNLLLDDRLVEYKFEDILLDTYSPYQHIQILKTVDYGNMLILDGAINLAEHDTAAYTHFIMDLKRVSPKLHCCFKIWLNNHFFINKPLRKPYCLCTKKQDREKSIHFNLQINQD